MYIHVIIYRCMYVCICIYIVYTYRNFCISPQVHVSASFALRLALGSASEPYRCNYIFNYIQYRFKLILSVGWCFCIIMKNEICPLVALIAGTGVRL